MCEGKAGNKKRSTRLETLLLNSYVGRFITHIKPVLKQIRLLTGLNVGGKTRNMASNVARQIARFLLPAFPYLKQQKNVGEFFRLLKLFVRSSNFFLALFPICFVTSDCNRNWENPDNVFQGFDFQKTRTNKLVKNKHCCA